APSAATTAPVAAPADRAAAPPPRALDRRGAALLSFAHFCTDFAQGAVPALLPVVVVSLGLSYAVAATLVLAVAASSSVLQPMFGLVADKRSSTWLAPVGVGLAGLGIALAGLAPGYASLVAALLVCGLGVAAFHPEAMRMATWVAGDQRAMGMSIFSVGGTAGFALAPVVAAVLMDGLGQIGLVLLGIPGIIAAGVAWRRLTYLEALRPPAPASTAEHRAVSGPDQWGAFAWLTGAIGMRSVAVSGISTFLPLYLVHDFGASAREGAVALSLFTGCGVLGSLAGGAIADRIGRRRLALWALWGSTAVLAPLAFVTAPWAAYLTLMLGGFVLFMPFSAMTVMGQSFLPSRVGTASGVTVGLAVTIGGLMAPVLGGVADEHGLRALYGGLVLVPVVASVLLMPLPRERVQAHARVVAAGEG
ncbi:MAG: MFS transporter, partial [Gemmatimonadaceae bacterium]|nr:MFS transporter [Gemmatimonadaceae bacterium]